MGTIGEFHSMQEPVFLPLTDYLKHSMWISPHIGHLPGPWELGMETVSCRCHLLKECTSWEGMVSQEKQKLVSVRLALCTVNPGNSLEKCSLRAAGML